jgi:hypothetical protein
MSCWTKLPANQRAQSPRLNPQRRAYLATFDTRRLWIGARYVGYAKTAAQAQAIRAHIKERLSAFKRQQAGTETEAAHADAVSIKTGL